MNDVQSLNHSRWDCKYHVVFIPKCRRRSLYEQLRRHLGEVFRTLAQQKVFLFQFGIAQAVRDGKDDLVVGERLFDEIVSTATSCLDRCFDGAVAGDHNHWYVEALADAIKGIHAAWHRFTFHHPL